MDSTMTICDSVATCVNKTAEICQHCVKETETSCLDVAIVFIICVAIAVVAIYAIRRYFKWKDDERTALANAAQQKRSYEEADRKLKQEANIEVRKQNKEDHELKRKEELQDHELKQKEEQQAHELKQKEEQQAHELKRKEDKQDYLLKRKEELENKMLEYMESQIKNGESLSKDDMYIDELTKKIEEIKSALNDQET
jgi:hypothetical protein